MKFSEHSVVRNAGKKRMIFHCDSTRWSRGTSPSRMAGIPLYNLYISGRMRCSVWNSNHFDRARFVSVCWLSLNYVSIRQENAIGFYYFRWKFSHRQLTHTLLRTHVRAPHIGHPNHLSFVFVCKSAHWIEMKINSRLRQRLSVLCSLFTIYSSSLRTLGRIVFLNILWIEIAVVFSLFRIWHCRSINTWCRCRYAIHIHANRGTLCVYVSVISGTQFEIHRQTAAAAAATAQWLKSIW